MLVHHLKSPVRYDQFDPGALPTESMEVKPELLVQLMLQAEAFGFWRIDVSTGNAWWSENVYRIHGMQPRKGTVNVSKAVALYHPEDAKTVEFLVGDAIANKNGFDFVLRLKRIDGKMRFVQAMASVELDTDKSVKTVYGIFRDVTQSISDKNISKTRAQLVSSIIANSPSPIAILDRKMCYLQISPAWAEFHGLQDPDSYVGKSHYEVLPEIPKEWRLQHQRVLKGETVHRSQALENGETRVATSASGASIFPWHTALGEIGGLIIMVTPPGNSETKQNKTAAQIARLMEQADHKPQRFGQIR